MSAYHLRWLWPVLLLAVFVPPVVHAQYSDETQGLFEIEPSKVDRSTNQVIIEFKEKEVIEDVETTEEATDQDVCCELPEDERLASDACANIICPPTP